MKYKSTFFEATKTVLKLSKQRDPKLIQLFFGVVGTPANLPVDAVQLKTELDEFCTSELKRGPLRKEDVRKVSQYVRMQEQRLGPLVLYDAETVTEWEWDGNPIALVVVCELACQAAIMLENQDLYSECVSLKWGALKCIEAQKAPQLKHIRLLARTHAQAIEKRFDVKAMLDAFDKRMPQVKHR
jgi:hypothetical protein